MPPIDPSKMSIGDVIKSCIITTASLANTLSDMTEGKQILPEHYYPELYNRYQNYLSKLIVAPRTAEQLKEINKKFIQIILDECNAEPEGETSKEG